MRKFISVFIPVLGVVLLCIVLVSYFSNTISRDVNFNDISDEEKLLIIGAEDVDKVEDTVIKVETESVNNFFVEETDEDSDQVEIEVEQEREDNQLLDDSDYSDFYVIETESGEEVFINGDDESDNEEEGIIIAD